MGIRDMLKREDFYTILRNTIIEYTRVVMRMEVRCEYTSFEGSEPWVVNSLLGFVSRVPMPRGLRIYMKSEYNVRGNFLKNLIGKAAVALISIFPRVGVSRIIYVSSGVFESTVFIVPQNRSIRFYDYGKMSVDCIVKSGFTSKYFDNQASFRKAYQYDFLNPMLKQGKGWFQEPVLLGHPLVRTTDNVLFAKGIEDALRYLKRLATDTLVWKPFKEYVGGLKEEALIKIDKAMREKSIVEAKDTIELINTAVSLAQTDENDIPTCLSHGDFQSGNIWMRPTGETLIYDWETAGRRSIWYDCATLTFSLRRSYGWKSLLYARDSAGLCKCLPDNVNAKRCMTSIIGILLLEDILFYLDDMLELPETWGNEDFDRFICNIKGLNWSV